MTLLPHLKIDKINTTLEFFGETNKRRRPMPGEESHTAQSHQLYTKERLSQMDTLSTVVTLLTLSMLPTPLPRLLDKLPSTLKKLLMPGERVPLQTLDQFFP